jgi:hypothetical protein
LVDDHQPDRRVVDRDGYGARFANCVSPDKLRVVLMIVIARHGHVHGVQGVLVILVTQEIQKTYLQGWLIILSNTRKGRAEGGCLLLLLLSSRAAR